MIYLIQCTINAAKQECDDDRAINYLTKLIDMTSTDFLINTCNDHYEGSAHCQALEPIGTFQIKDKNGFGSNPQSFVRPLIDMFSV